MTSWFSIFRSSPRETDWVLRIRRGDRVTIQQEDHEDARFFIVESELPVTLLYPKPDFSASASDESGEWKQNE